MSRSKQPVNSNIAKEPYRFVCIACGSVSLKRKSGIIEKETSYNNSYFKNLSHEYERNFKFKCKECKATSKWAYDKKKGCDIHITSLSYE